MRVHRQVRAQRHVGKQKLVGFKRTLRVQRHVQGTSASKTKRHVGVLGWIGDVKCRYNRKSTGMLTTMISAE